MKQILILAADLVHCALLKWGHYSDQYATWLVQKVAALADAEATLGELAQQLDVCRYEDRRDLFSKIHEDLRVHIAKTSGEPIAPQHASLYEVYRVRYAVDPAMVALLAKHGRLKCGVVAYDFASSAPRTICECPGCSPR
jgi:hypothetical protein